MTKDPLKTSYSLGHKDRTHFDWPNVEAVLVKVKEELDEFAESLSESRLAQIHELGDLLFSIVQAARHLEIDPGLALETANERYQNRFNAMKSLIKKEGQIFEDTPVDQLEDFWKRAKKTLKQDEINHIKEKFNL